MLSLPAATIIVRAQNPHPRSPNFRSIAHSSSGRPSSHPSINHILPSLSKSALRPSSYATTQDHSLDDFSHALPVVESVFALWLTATAPVDMFMPHAESVEEVHDL